MLNRILRTIRNCCFSPGVRLFGPRFTVEYLRIAARTARHWGASGPGELTIAGRRVAYLNETDAVFLVHEIFVNATYDFQTARERPVVLDCGANIGMATLFFKARYPKAEVVAIEPDPQTFARLQESLVRNGVTDVRTLQAAVAEEAGEVVLYTNAVAGNISASTDRALGGSVVCTVPAVRLSTLVNGPIDFLKLDVEGAEFGVVRELMASGAMRLIEQAVIEYHDPDPARARREWLVGALEQSGMHVQRLQEGPNGVGLLRAGR